MLRRPPGTSVSRSFVIDPAVSILEGTDNASKAIRPQAVCSCFVRMHMVHPAPGLLCIGGPSKRPA
jgi:hypothetical protein